VSPQDLFDQADRLEEEGQQERALAAWQQLAETHPTRNVFLRLASITKDLGLIDDTESAYKRALEIDGRSALALKGLGLLAIHRRDYEVAEGFLKRACEIEEDPPGLTLLGVALHNTGKVLEAEEAYRKAIRIDPMYEEAYFNLGVVLRDRPSEAQVLFRKALELDPEYACAYRELGYILSMRGPDSESESNLRKAIQLEPGDAWTHIYLGTHLWRCDDIEAATAEFRIAEKLEPEWVVPLWSLGHIYECAYEDFDLAQSLYERALQLEPDDQVALMYIGRLFKKRGQFDLAREYLGRALLLDPNDGRARTLLSDIDSDRSA
jgi:tetratricopeptide (TPR) repeat protein